MVSVLPSSVVTVRVGPENLRTGKSKPHIDGPPCSCGARAWVKEWNFRWDPGSNTARQQDIRRCLGCQHWEPLRLEHGG